jgi:hypothetical protein
MSSRDTGPVGRLSLYFSALSYIRPLLQLFQHDVTVQCLETCKSWSADSFRVHTLRIVTQRVVWGQQARQDMLTATAAPSRKRTSTAMQVDSSWILEGQDDALANPGPSVLSAAENVTGAEKVRD